MTAMIIRASSTGMGSDPLLPHLLDIVSNRDAEGLILIGGFGMRLKQQDIAAREAQTLIPVVPPARATQDLDIFLRLDFFLDKERGGAVRELLRRLSYAKLDPNWQFVKPLGDGSAGKVKVDLLAREPRLGEAVKVRGHRVGSGAGVDLHGYRTPEAFAVEEAPAVLRVAGLRTDGSPVEAEVLVPNPYAWLTMKVKAAHDWLRMERGELERKPFREKHAFDVYVLVAMLSEVELAAASMLAMKYFEDPIAAEVRQEAVELYGIPEAPGFLEAQRQAESRLDHALFWAGLQDALRVVP